MNLSAPRRASRHLLELLAKTVAAATVLAFLAVSIVALSPASAAASMSHAPAFAGNQHGTQQNSRAHPDTEDPVAGYDCPPCVCAVYDTPSGGTYITKTCKPLQQFCKPLGTANCDLAMARTPIGPGFPKKGLLFSGVSDGSDSIYVYNSKFKQINTLTGLPGVAQGLAMDATGNLWAVGPSCSDSACVPTNDLTEFDPGSSIASQIYTDPYLNSADYVAVDGSGNVFVSGLSASGDGGGQVDEMYAGMSGTFFTIVRNSSAMAGGVAIDPSNGDLWVSSAEGSLDLLTSYAPPTYEKQLDTFFTEGFDTGLSIDSKHDLFAANNVTSGSTVTSQLLEYKLPKGKGAGKILGSSPPDSNGPAYGVAVWKNELTK